MTCLVPQGDEDGLDVVEHVVHLDERRLDVDLCELGLAVVAKVLVAKAAGELEVAVQPRDHQQLLVDLGGLRQGVELAGVHARRDEVVARPLGGGLGEHRRLDLEESEVGERFPRPLQQPVPQDEVRLHLRTPQVQMAVLEPQLLGGQLLTLAPGHGNRGRHSPPDHREFGRAHLHVARR